MMGVLRPWQGGEFADRKVTRVQLSTSVVRVGPTVWRAETVRVTWASLQLKGAVMHRLFKRAANTPPTLLNGSDGRSGITSAIVASTAARRTASYSSWETRKPRPTCPSSAARGAWEPQEPGDQPDYLWYRSAA